MPKTIKIFTYLIIAILIVCTPNDPSLTGTSEHENARILASIYTSEGLPATGTTIRLRPANYRSQSLNDTQGQPNEGIINTVVDTSGLFNINTTTLPAGDYVIEANDNMREALQVPLTITSNDSSILLGANKLKPYSSISGKVTLQNSSQLYSVTIFGLERLIPVDSNGVFIVNDLPEGTFTLQIDNSVTSTAPSQIKDITTSSGTTILIPENSWYHYQKIYLNTTLQETKISETIVNFPVLIRLSSSNFDFSQSTKKGKDLWFMKSNYKLLSFQIEEWDSTAQRASVWVGIDTIHVDDSSQSFIMHWGNVNSTINQTPGNVFETGAGFQGVWHCNETTTEEAVDNTFNRFDGMRVRMNVTEGIIGNGQLFDGDSSYFIVKNSASSILNFDELSDYTLCAWVKATKIDSEHIIIGKGLAQYNLKIKDRNWVFSEFVANPEAGEISVRAPATVNEWVYLCGVSRNGKRYLYINGTIADSTSLITASTILRNETYDVEIGRLASRVEGSISSFSGTLDEISVSSFARNDDWIKLSYDNQSQQSRLIIMEK